MKGKRVRERKREEKKKGRLEDKEDFCLVEKKKEAPKREQRAVTWSHNGRRTATGIVTVPYCPCHGVTPDNTNTMTEYGLARIYAYITRPTWELCQCDHAFLGNVHCLNDTPGC